MEEGVDSVVALVVGLVKEAEGTMEGELDSVVTLEVCLVKEVEVLEVKILSSSAGAAPPTLRKGWGGCPY